LLQKLIVPQYVNLCIAFIFSSCHSSKSRFPSHISTSGFLSRGIVQETDVDGGTLSAYFCIRSDEMTFKQMLFVTIECSFGRKSRDTYRRFARINILILIRSHDFKSAQMIQYRGGFCLGVSLFLIRARLMAYQLCNIYILAHASVAQRRFVSITFIMNVAHTNFTTEPKRFNKPSRT
jgi:hypothetical protein